MTEQLRSFLPERRDNGFQNLFSPQRRTQSQPNIFQRFTDVFSPSRRAQERSTNPFSEILNRFTGARSSSSQQRGGRGGSLTNMFQQFMNMAPQPPASRPRQPSYGSIGGMFRSLSAAFRPRREVKSTTPIAINSGRVKIIQILDPMLKSPQEILTKIEELKGKYLPGQLREARSHSEGPLSITLEMGRQIKAKKVKIQNLIYSHEVIKGNTSTHSKPLSMPPPKNNPFLLLSGFSHNRTSQKLLIQPRIKTHLLNATEIVEPSNVRATRQFVPDLYYGLTPSIRAKHLQVTSINGIPWSKYYESLFLKSRDIQIEGRLIFQSPLVEVQHLKTTMLNHLEVDKLFNMRQSQVVNSKLMISRFFVRELEAETVNGLKFEEDVVFSGRDAYVESEF